MKGGSGDGKEKAGIEGIRSLFRHSLHLVFLESENRIPDVYKRQEKAFSTSG